MCPAWCLYHLQLWVAHRTLPGNPQVLDLSHNAVHHQEDLAALSQLPQLQQVVLVGNPMARTVRHKQAALTKAQVCFTSTTAGTGARSALIAGPLITTLTAAAAPGDDC